MQRLFATTSSLSLSGAGPRNGHLSHVIGEFTYGSGFVIMPFMITQVSPQVAHETRLDQTEQNRTCSNLTYVEKRIDI